MKKIILALLILFIQTSYILGFDVNSYKSNIVRFSYSSLEEKLFLDAQDGELNNIFLIEAGLIASGVNDTQALKLYSDRVKNIIVNIQALKKFHQLSDYQKSEVVLFYLHKLVLKTYHTHASRLDVLLDKGIFNCASSAFLYNVILRELNIKAQGVTVPDHVFSMIVLPEKKIDVETTTIDGFDPEGKNKDRKSFQKLTGYKRTNRLKRQIISDIQFVATIYSNMGGFAELDKNYPKGIVNSIKALKLYPNMDEGLSNLKANYTNWANQLNKTGKFDLALQVMTEAYINFPEDELVLNALLASCQLLTKQLVLNKDFDQAFQLVRTAKKIFPTDEELQDLFLQVYNRYWLAEVEANHYPKALEIITQGKKEIGEIDVFNQMEIVTYISWSNFNVINKNYEEAIRLSHKALEMFPKNQQLIDQLKLCYLAKGTGFFKSLNYNEGSQFFEGYLKEYANDEEMKDLYSRFYIVLIRKALEDKNFQKAEEYSRLGYKRFPDNKKLEAHLLMVYIKQIEDAVMAEKITLADKKKQELLSIFQNQSKKEEVGELLYLAIYQRAAKLEKYQQGIDYLKIKWQKEQQHRKLLSDILYGLIAKQTNVFIKKNQWEAGHNFVKSMSKAGISLPKLSNLEKEFYYNWLGYLHDKRDYDEGLKIANEALLLDPNDNQLKAYQRFFKKNLVNK